MILSKHLILLGLLGTISAFGAAACGDDDPATPGKDSNGDSDVDSETAVDTDTDTDTQEPEDTDTFVKVGTSIFPPVGEGWIGEADNPLHVQGSWYTFGCDVATVEPLGEITRTDKGICFKGTSPKVIDVAGDGDLDWSDMWGAGMGFDLCAYAADEPDTELAETKNAMGACPFNPDLAEGFIGIQADITGSVTSRDPLRVMFNEGENVSNTYVEFTEGAPGTVTAFTKKAYAITWFGTEDATALKGRYAQVWYDTSAKPEGVLVNNLLALHFQIPADQENDIAWDFCITDVRFLTEADLPVEDTDTDTDTTL